MGTDHQEAEGNAFQMGDATDGRESLSRWEVGGMSSRHLGAKHHIKIRDDLGERWNLGLRIQLLHQ